MKIVPQAHGGAVNRLEKGETANPNGRPPKLVSHINKELKEKGYEPVSATQIQDCFTQMLNLSIKEIKEIANPDTEYPFLYKLVAKELLGKRGAEMLEKMLDRAHGKAKQQIEASISGEIKINITVDESGL